MENLTLPAVLDHLGNGGTRRLLIDWISTRPCP